MEAEAEVDDIDTIEEIAEIQEWGGNHSILRSKTVPPKRNVNFTS